MMKFAMKTILAATAVAALAGAAWAQADGPSPWELKPDMGYAYGKDGKLLSYKMGTNNAGLLLKGVSKLARMMRSAD